MNEFGRIKVLNGSYGFIIRSTRGGDVFFHGASVLAPLTIDDLKVGDHVSFEEGQGRQGPCAVHVTIASPDA